jgi:hypothetical protein
LIVMILYLTGGFFLCYDSHQFIFLLNMLPLGE